MVGFVGLGMLASYTLDEWMRTFIAGAHDFDNFGVLAEELKAKIQADFDKDFPGNADVREAHLIIHLGGFVKKGDVFVPVMCHIWNHDGIDPKTGHYPPAERIFRLSEDIESNFKKWPNPEDYPARIRQRLQRMIDERRYLWFNNGANLGAFLIFRDFIWQALHTIQDAGFGPTFTGLGARVAFCKMAVEVFGSYFTHHFDPEDRIVGGGVDIGSIPWPQE